VFRSTRFKHRYPKPHASRDRLADALRCVTIVLCLPLQAVEARKRHQRARSWWQSRNVPSELTGLPILEKAEILCHMRITRAPSMNTPSPS
jgi:hypothetical protein